MVYSIYPSLLSADLMRLGDEVEAVINAGADAVHLDVMDNHYVPNLTFGPLICQALHKRFPHITIDAHLMVTPVDSLIDAFADAGAHRLSIHPNATMHLDRSLQRIQEKGCLAGLVLDPATSPDCIAWCQHRLDFLLIMTVNPGFGGQTLIPAVIEKIAAVHRLYPQLPICVDGGVTIDNIAELAHAGASQFVAGSAIFHSKHYEKTISAMKQKLHSIVSTNQ